MNHRRPHWHFCVGQLLYLGDHESRWFLIQRWCCNVDKKLLLFVFCSVDRCQFHFQFVSPQFSFNFKTSLTTLAANFVLSISTKTQYFQTFSLSWTATSSIVMITIVDIVLLTPAVGGYSMGIVWVALGQKLRRWVWKGDTGVTIDTLWPWL